MNNLGTEEQRSLKVYWTEYWMRVVALLAKGSDALLPNKSNA